MTKRILLIGSSSKICQKFIERASKIYSLTTCTRNLESDFYIDLGYPNTFNNIRGYYDRTIVFTGITNIRECEENQRKAFDINYTNSVQLINSIKYKCKEILIISTSSVFSNKSTGNYEDAGSTPSCYYGLTKKLLEDYCIKEGISILRITKIIDDLKILDEWIGNIKKGHKIKAFKDVLIAPILYEHVISEIIEWIEKSFNGIRHITSDQSISYHQIAEYLTEWLNKPGLALEQSSKEIYLPYKPCQAHLDCRNPNSKNLNTSQVMQKYRATKIMG